MSLNTIFSKDNPKNDQKFLWRYMPLDKYLDMLAQQRLFFNRVNFFDDSFEGIWPVDIIDSNKAVWQVSDKEKMEAIKGYDGEEAEIRVPISYGIDTSFANCWYSDQYESSAMWEVYGKGNNSIAVKVTENSLKRELSKAVEKTGQPFKLLIEPVQYVDFYNKTKYKTFQEVWPCFIKHHSYKYESEVRAVITAQNNVDGLVKGIYVNLNIKDFIHSIIISPKASDWFFSLVNKITKKYKYNYPILRSNLASTPFKKDWSWKSQFPKIECIDIDLENYYNPDVKI